MDPQMNNLLKWSIENSAASQSAPSQSRPPRSLSPSALQRLLDNTPSDAELMKAAMAVIRSEDATLENKLIAFDNFEQLVENLDNANNLEVLGLWEPLVQELGVEEGERRMMAAWCVGTAVQNNVKAQEKFLTIPSSVEMLVRLSAKDPDTTVRRKAVYALSSTVRNFQPGLDELCKHLPSHVDWFSSESEGKIDAGDMERIDSIMNKLKEA